MYLCCYKNSLQVSFILGMQFSTWGKHTFSRACRGVVGSGRPTAATLGPEW